MTTSVAGSHAAHIDGTPASYTDCDGCHGNATYSVTNARGAPIWFQLYASPQWEVAQALIKRAESAGCPVLAVTVDRVGGRNQETLFRLRRSDSGWAPAGRRYVARTWLDTLGREVTIVDEIVTNGRHSVSLHLHFAERCRVEDPLGQEVRIHAGSFVARLHVDPRFRTTIVRADVCSMEGWESRGYHRKSAAATLKAEALITGNTTLVTRLSL